MSIAIANILEAIPESGLSLEELTSLASTALLELGIESEDGRTSSAIDTRTVRFYQTLGILPKPIYQGRRAVYALTHLVRALAAKQLQAEGFSLAQIQSALPQQSDDALVQALTLAMPAESHLTVLFDRPTKEPTHCETPSTVQASSVPPPDHAVAELRSFTLIQGVTLLIDPNEIHAPAELAAALRQLTRSHLTTADRSDPRSPASASPRTPKDPIGGN